MLYLLLFHGMQDIGEATMIINGEREPELSLYYIGSILLEILEHGTSLPINQLIQKVQHKLDEKIHVDFIYYALDWLFLLSAVRIDEGMVYYENKKVNSTQNQTF